MYHMRHMFVLIRISLFPTLVAVVTGKFRSCNFYIEWTMVACAVMKITISFVKPQSSGITWQIIQVAIKGC